jgi:hypothetical protein
MHCHPRHFHDDLFVASGVLRRKAIALSPDSYLLTPIS